MENEPEKTNLGWLQELAAKSWNLEMTISGAATVAVSFLPGLLENALDYYINDLAPSTSKFAIMFPFLSYSFFMVVAWVLLGFFGMHLMMRALWVGAVGLHSAYPAGIQFDRMPNATEAMKKVMQEKYGTLDKFIYRLDKRANSMFALAFMIAMGMASVGVIYLIVFSAMLLLRNYVDAETLSWYGTIAYYCFIVLMVGVFVFNYWLKKHPERHVWAEKMARGQMAFGSVMLPVFYRPVQYLTMTFATNVSRKSYVLSMVFIIFFMMGSTLFVTMRKVGQWTGRSLSFDRAYFSEGSDRYRMQQNAYDNLREDGAMMTNISIPAEVVGATMLPVFVKYPHYLDNRLVKFCPDTPEADTSLNKRQVREWTDSLRIACFSQFLHLGINDSIQPAAEWLFMEKSGIKGLVAYLPIAGLPTGKNTLKVQIPSENKADSLETFGSLHFWFFPEK